MPLCCFGEKEPLFGRSIEDLLENDLTDHSNREMIPKEIQQFVNYLSEKNALQYKEYFLNNVDPKEKNKLLKKLNKSGKVDFKNYDNIHAVIEVFLEFLRRMPGRIVSREQFDNFKCVNGHGSKKDIKKIKKGLDELPPYRLDTLKYLITFFSGKTRNELYDLNIDIEDILSIVPVLATAIIETPSDYTLSSKIYKNGNIINFSPNTNNALECIKNRENITKFLIINYDQFFTNENQRELGNENESESENESGKSKSKSTLNKLSNDQSEALKDTPRECPPSDLQEPTKLSDNQNGASKHSLRSSRSIHNSQDPIKLSDNQNSESKHSLRSSRSFQNSKKSIKLSDNQNSESKHSLRSSCSLQNSQKSIKLSNNQNITSKHSLSSSHSLCDSQEPTELSDDHEKQKFSSRSGSIYSSNESSKLSDDQYDVPKYSSKSSRSSKPQNVYDSSEATEFNIRMSSKQHTRSRSLSSSGSTLQENYNKYYQNEYNDNNYNNSSEYDDTDDPYNNNNNFNIQIKNLTYKTIDDKMHLSLTLVSPFQNIKDVRTPQSNTSNNNDFRYASDDDSLIDDNIDESVISELQSFLKATRRYLYDLRSFPLNQVKELYNFSKKRYTLVKNILADAPYINLEPIINSQIFGPNNYHISYEGLKDLTPAQETLRDYDIYKRKNNINEFIFQKSKKQCQMEKKYLYQKLLILKDNTKDDNDRHILHELNKIYKNIRENLKKNSD
ncbi:Rho GTPase activation protein [Neocallimastix lanati (nom. inval.)]|jgi:hypothetical protein|uniref:Rho GTPase activation protein n=1 Tax=Neocallimastix californiae TaxID=1754190 RepID=A0A1Y2CJY3_9FUNG|nr:Rho GTPase activation protein [Neocallimastix sp. JGI-2020a]ORY46655.1 Rho GTPase activation protein [Neocallimastix californiae]|eukprot:ORY46655.1 Rho GTPase activation protein [Neocallimastix californiae]